MIILMKIEQQQTITDYNLDQGETLEALGHNKKVQ